MHHMRYAAAGILVVACTPPGQTSPMLQPGQLPASWYAGGPDCRGAPQFQVHAYNDGFFVLRQAACTNFEKPFLYLIFGQERARPARARVARACRRAQPRPR